AGLACARAAAAGSTLRALDLKALQFQLVEQGILAPDVPGHSDSFPLPGADVQAAVERGAVDLFSTAAIFAHPEQSVPLLLQQLGDGDPRREDAALILGLLGRSEAGAPLAELVAAREWDDGWDYRGMGQF